MSTTDVKPSIYKHKIFDFDISHLISPSPNYDIGRKDIGDDFDIRQLPLTPLSEELDFRRKIYELKMKADIIDKQLFNRVMNSRLKAIYQAEAAYDQELQFYIGENYSVKKAREEALKRGKEVYNKYAQNYDDLMGDVIKVKEKKAKKLKNPDSSIGIETLTKI
ncbi:MAG: hypothetical protein WC554_01990 [Clostridia bacterium]